LAPVNKRFSTEKYSIHNFSTGRMEYDTAS
jgi:hypothetical protein